MAVRDDIGHRKHVAERFRHLLFVDEQMLDVHPDAGELLVRRALAMRDLVLMMLKDQVDAAAMNVDRRLAEQPQRHRRAFQMPAAPSGNEAQVPRWLVDLIRGSLPPG